MDRDDIPLPDITTQGKAVIEKLQQMSQEELAENLYYVETFIPAKRRSNLQNIQENFENSYKKISNYMESEDYMTATIMMLYKFYEMYYYNNLQEDVNQVVADALQRSSEQPWEEAAPILYKAMEAIMEDELDEYDPDDDEDDEDEENNGFDMNQYMQNIQALQQQMAQGSGMQEYLQQVQVLQQQMLSGQISVEEYTAKVQKLAAKNFGK